MFDDTYLTIEDRAEGVYKEKGSKFISLAFPVTTQEEIKEIVKDIKKEYFDARHHCYAYILGHDKSVFRMNDDGEPSSTAGKPIYGQLLSKDLTNILVVVVRYFGGTKLGVSGLIQAYKQATIDVLNNSKIIEKTVDEVYSVSFDYSLMNDVMKVMKEYDLHQQNHKFENDCYLEFRIRKRDSKVVVDNLKFIDNVLVEFITTI
ncbi:MAG: YigZ family protein [Bacteroidales bacterium]|nr:YigZ family protein [Bacteroidales bacterium]MEA4966612.1 YigZ family protein [Bacteroidaceae bacterium]MDD2576126.1 YigZ family protein [Bacteroidales bacterium]MDD3287175.1 YigZ family protein [Bacteroidales bacterium]MDD3668092.1 YigZ family protein [Bacteroidales bacterium]